MKPILISVIIFLFSLRCFAQVIIKGKISEYKNSKPIANASVFLNNATIGCKSTDDGSFTLMNVKPGRYELVVSIIGFESIRKMLIVENTNIDINEIKLHPKTLEINEVKISYRTDPNRERYIQWFKEAFIGNSLLAQDCKILNPDALELNYDDRAKRLNASTSDFLEIENDALGYKIKYSLANFTLDNSSSAKFYLDYQGTVLFEELDGTKSQKRLWSQHREEAYQGSFMHFLRAVLNDHLTSEGFRVLRLVKNLNPARPTDSLIEAKISLFKKLNNKSQKDSLSYWKNKAKLNKTVDKLVTVPLQKRDILRPTEWNGLYAIGFGTKEDALYISYNKDRHFHVNRNPKYLNDLDNKENSLIQFNCEYALFDKSGRVINPTCLVFSGVWSKNGIADLLPVDYTPLRDIDLSTNYSAFGNISAKFDTFFNTRLPEKAYLHFDKPYYAAGDTIYFKAYLTSGENHKLSNLSDVLHVDLINTKNEVGKSIKLQLDSGIANGDFVLPDSLPPGNYRIRAYTRWMENNDSYGFFEESIPVGSLLAAKVPESLLKSSVQTSKLRADLQFFPEGGNLVSGIRSKVAFKATGSNGEGVDVKGTVFNQNNKEVCTFSSVHLGMGYFNLEPKAGETYKIEYTIGGLNDEVTLPNPQTKGIVLSIDNDSIAKASLRITTNLAYFEANRNKDYLLLIYSGGILTSVNCKLDSQVINLDILKRKLSTGIATVTLFSNSGEPFTYLLDKIPPVSVLSELKVTNAVKDTTMSVYLKNTGKDRNETINYGRGKGIMLKEVKIRYKKIDDQYNTESLAGAGHADQVMHADEIEKIGGPLSSSLNGRLHGVVLVNGTAYLTAPRGDGPMLILLDGIEMNGGKDRKGNLLPYDVDQIPSSQVETVEVLRFASASIYGLEGGNGVLIITTKKGGGRDIKDMASVGVLPISPVGFYKARRFYSPRYDFKDSVGQQHDFRSTIYWLPELTTDKNGNYSFDFYNSDGSGTYKVVVEGIDENGNLGRQIYRYTVK